MLFTGFPAKKTEITADGFQWTGVFKKSNLVAPTGFEPVLPA